MKIKVIFSFFFLCILKTYSFNLFAAPDSLKVIISCGTKDDAKITSLKNILKADSTINYVAFCSNHSVFLIEMVGTPQSANAYVISLRKSVGLGDQTLSIKEYTFGDILNYCDSDIEKDLKKRRQRRK